MQQNQLKKIASLAHSKYRKQHGLFLVEGIHSVMELLKTTWHIEMVVVTFNTQSAPESAPLLNLAADRKIPIEVLNQPVFEKLATTETPQGVMAVARLSYPDIGKLTTQKKILIADGIADPGNLGTMIRTAVAFGFESIITTPGSADIFSPKAVRATQGALFSIIPFSHIAPDDLLPKLQKTHSLIAITSHTSESIDSLKKSARLALVVGAEIAGVSPAIIKAADFKVKIPISDSVESLNAAVAAGIAMYELS
jgi:RNA methyltransferase, TrmH family